ncbi:MAG TPA: beta-galactosidase [Candidatus Brocadiia bacterium]|nr:beta-galactosidase [Candidatus Brocadiia bacterium]
MTVNSPGFPSWFDDAFLVAGGWEPLMYLRRDGSRDCEEDFVRQHTDESLQGIAGAGIGLFITHYYKGHGWRVIQDELGDVKRQVAALHRAGARAGVYLRVDNVMDETFFLERPEARAWLAVTQDGRNPTILNRYYRQRVCRNVPEYREHIAQVIRYALAEIGADLVHLDGFHGSSEREECRCAHCQARFQRFLAARWGGRPEEAKRRFGFGRVDGITIPPVGPGNLSESTATFITDPVYQEYIRFRCEDWAEWHGFVQDVVRRANPEAVISLNCGVFSWQNTTAQAGVYLPLLNARNTCVFIEDGHFAGVREGGVLSHRIRDYKVADALGLRCIAYCHQHSVLFVKRAMAESLAFNSGSLGHVNTAGDVNAGRHGGEAEQRAVAEMAQWRRANADLYRGAAPAAEVGVLRGYESMTYDCYDAWRHTMLVEETLIRNQIPFDPVFDEQLDELLGRRIKLLVLANQSCLSDRTIDAVQAFLSHGGRVLATGRTGARRADAKPCRENRLIRALSLPACAVAPAAGPIAGQEVQARFESAFADQASDTAMNTWPGRAAVFEQVMGHGRLVYLPEVIPSVQQEIWRPQWRFNPAAASFDIVGEVNDPLHPHAKEYAFVNWRLPVNQGQIVDAVRWLYDAPFVAAAPDTVAVEWRFQPGQGRELLHFVNYANTDPVLAASLWVREGRYASAEFRGLDPAPARVDVPIPAAGGHVRIPPFQTCAVLVLRPGQRRRQAR